MPEVVVDVAWLARIQGEEAARLAEVEDGRFLDLARGLSADDWGGATDCDGWDVRDLVSHVVGAYEGLASFRELVHQLGQGPKVAKELGIEDRLAGTNELQVRERAACKPDELIARLERAGPLARRRRRRLAGPLRHVRVPVTGDRPLSLGDVLAVVYTRGIWMHRVDLSRATSREMRLSHDHDGRIVADVVQDWASHGQPFRLELSGPAGATFLQGEGGEELSMDAVEFCRTLAGREKGTSLLRHQVVF